MFTFVGTPEPSFLLLIGAGLICLGTLARRRIFTRRKR